MHSSHTLRTTLKNLRFSDDERTARDQNIVQRLLDTSICIRRPDFDILLSEDLRSLFHLYDETFFGGLLQESLQDTPLDFRISPRMTRAGARTSAWKDSPQTPFTHFEIAVSSTLLFNSFQDEPPRPVLVNGLECRNRLDALMRIMEHELIHLAELVGWGDSSCRKERFQQMAGRIFGHTDYLHTLMTPRQQAAERGIRRGSSVTFQWNGRLFRGIVSRITKRATVLVPSPDGVLYSDGVCYEKYYVPLDLLHPVKAADGGPPPGSETDGSGILDNTRRRGS